MGPFEEEEEGTGIASDVIKVQGAESGHPRSPDLRNDTGEKAFLCENPCSEHFLLYLCFSVCLLK